MADYIIHNAEGRILSIVGCAPNEIELAVASNGGAGAIEGRGHWETNYVAGGVVVPFPQRPSPSHDWDWTSKSWVPDVAKARVAKKLDVERERDRRITAPVIVYDSKNLDADESSIGRVANKLAALDAYEKCGQVMPAPMLVWRDADNATHSFASHQEYKLWLAGFAVALDARGTAAFAWSWEKKARVDTAQTVAAVEAIGLSD